MKNVKQMILNKQEILKDLEENKEQIKGYGVKKIGLFGSYIRNEQRERSDIDILVEFEKEKITFDNYIHLKFFLEDLLGCKIDLVIRDDLKRRLKPYILKEVEYAKEL